MARLRPKGSTPTRSGPRWKGHSPVERHLLEQLPQRGRRKSSRPSGPSRRTTCGSPGTTGPSATGTGPRGRQPRAHPELRLRPVGRRPRRPLGGHLLRADAPLERVELDDVDNPHWISLFGLWGTATNDVWTVGDWACSCTGMGATGRCSTAGVGGSQRHPRHGPERTWTVGDVGGDPPQAVSCSARPGWPS